MKVLRYILLIILIIGVIIMAQIIGSRGTTSYGSTTPSPSYFPSYLDTLRAQYQNWKPIPGWTALQQAAISKYGLESTPYRQETTPAGQTYPAYRRATNTSTRTSGSSSLVSEVVKALVEYQSPLRQELHTPSAPSAPGYDFPQFNIGIPDLSWNPTENMRGTWLEEAVKRAALQIDPQVASREQGLNRFNAAAEANRTELNPRYDRMSSAVANIFKNVVDQALVNNAIRRGAAGSGVTSGWLGQERMKAGQEELGQRKGIENERNDLLNAINAQVLGKEQETTDALGQLEGLRGKQTDVSYADLERLARGDFLQEKQGTFENQLQNAIFQGGYSTDQANFLLNKFNSESAASLGQAELALKGRETSLNEAMGQYSMTPNTGYSAEAKPYTINIGGQEVPVSTSQFLQHFYQTQNSGGNDTQAFLDWLDKK